MDEDNNPLTYFLFFRHSSKLNNSSNDHCFISNSHIFFSNLQSWLFFWLEIEIIIRPIQYHYLINVLSRLNIIIIKCSVQLLYSMNLYNNINAKMELFSVIKIKNKWFCFWDTVHRHVFLKIILVNYREILL